MSNPRLPTAPAAKKSSKAAPVPVVAPVAQCVGAHHSCPEPVLAKERCQAHYRRFLRRGDKDKNVDDAPVLTHRGDLVPLSLRVTEAASKELDKAGGGYRIGAEIIEAWAADRLSNGEGISAAEEVLELRAQVVALKAQVKASKSRS